MSSNDVRVDVVQAELVVDVARGDAVEPLACACERAGLEVVLAREQFHPGWPSACPYDGRENAQVVARKKS